MSRSRSFRTIWLMREPSPETLRVFDIVCMMRERTRFPRSLIERLPNLKLLVTSGMRNPSIDLNAAKKRGVTV